MLACLYLLAPPCDSVNSFLGKSYNSYRQWYSYLISSHPLLSNISQQSPEIFFFVLLPPIIFEAGYSLDRKGFFDNVGAITLFAMFGTMISTFTVGLLSWYCAEIGLIANVDQNNPMEALLFGALISAVDPVATLSIMGNAELRCDPLLYSLVFGESVLNDAIAISLFRVFAKYYNPDGPDWNEANIPAALFSFVTVSISSVAVGVGLGLLASFVYRHTILRQYPNLETSLLFSFCYLCYAVGEAMGLSGIMALFFQGVTLSHYNAHNLSETALTASEMIFATLATISETAVFLYMGAGVFTGRFSNYDPLFSVLALLFCLLGRALNIFPLSAIANACRSGGAVVGGMNGSGHSNRSRGSVVVSSGDRKISIQMQCVLWFAGLRGAIAFALAMNMPGPNRDVYATCTLTICIFTTVVCGGLTERILAHFGMKQSILDTSSENAEEDDMPMNSVTFTPDSLVIDRRRRRSTLARHASEKVYKGAKKLWKQIDDDFLKPNFGGSMRPRSVRGSEDHLGEYELSALGRGSENSSEESDDEEGHFGNGTNGRSV